MFCAHCYAGLHGELLGQRERAFELLLAAAKR